MYIDWKSDKVQRVYTGTIIFVGLVVMFCLRLLPNDIGTWVFDIFIMAIAGMAVYEIMKAKKAEKRGVAPYYIYAYMVGAYVIFMIGIITVFPMWLHLLMQVVVFGIFAFYTFIMNFVDKDFVKEMALKKQKVARGALQTSIEFAKIAGYPFLMLFSMVFMNHLHRWAETPLVDGGEKVAVAMVSMLSLLLVFVISCFTDTFAYVIGSKLGGKKLCPKISPNKTISGAVGGLFGGTIGAMIVLLIFALDSTSPLSVFLAGQLGQAIGVIFFILIGIMGSAITMAGDIYASWLKRKCEIKDFGKLLPGHGGVMDRLDGICFNAVFIWLMMMFVVFL